MSEKEKKYLQYLTERFNEEHFTEFVKDLLNLETNDFSIAEISNIQGSYKEYISSYKKVASYEIGIEKIGVFIVKVNDSVSSKRVSSARVMQRNYAATLLDSHGLDAALVAFYSDNESAWRISLVKREAKLTSSGIEQELSQARRYSYLVGEGETVHTAQEFLLKLLNQNDTKFTVSEIEECFDVEKVTDKFFEEYKEKYLQLQEYLEKDKDFKTESKLHEFTSAEFAKKLMGQIVFLYFLQKKGWLGVQLIPNELSVNEFKELLATYQNDNVSKRLLNQFYVLKNERYVYTLENLKTDVFEINEDIANLTNIFKETKYDMPWGSGDKNFIRNLYEKSVSENKNFFEDYLEPLFYMGLDKDRINSYFALFNCKIPFLNGGTFEELNGYRWSSARFNIPNSLFSNNGDGILDFLDLYNFTIDEDEPLEKEIAVDPEMLGKIFENLLDVKDRRSKGAFYTPREIVYYMCCESLANYLVNKVGVDYNEIIFFIKNGDIISQIDWDLHNDNKENFIIGKTIYNNIINIDDALINVKIADPAVGSGAFPVGMITEIVKLRINLQTYMMIQDDLNIINIEDLYNTEHMTYELYELKRQTIENCIYAVDSESSAVDIAKLRVWLSLIVDYPNNEEPEPLPNLDYKIMQGNSLLDEYNGIKLFDSKRLKDFSKKYNKKFEEKKLRQVNLQISFDKNKNIEEQLKQLCSCQAELFKISDINRKAELKKLVENIQLRIIDSSINDFGKSQVVLSAIQKREKPWFLWQLEFYDIFKNNGGFDIVIGNPPYGANIDELIDVYGRKFPETSRGYKDIYKYFFNIAVRELLNENGILCYITPNTYFKQPRYKDLREYLLNYRIIKLINLGADVFDANVLTAIIVATKNYNHNDFIEMADLSVDSKYNGKINDFELKKIEQNIFSSNPDYSFVIPYYILKDNDIPFHKLIVPKDAGINYQRVSVGLKEKGKSDLSSRLLYEGRKINLNDIEYWKGVDINQFYISPSTSRFCRPYIELKKNERIVLNRDYFSIKPKILWRQTAPYPICAIDNRGIWFGRSIQAGIISSEYSNNFTYEYVCCLMNSNYLRFLYSKFVEEDGRLFPQVKLEKLSNLPFKIIDSDIQKIFSELYYKIINGNKAALIEMNNLVYKIYEVSPNESIMIDAFFNQR